MMFSVFPSGQFGSEPPQSEQYHTLFTLCLLSCQFTPSSAVNVTEASSNRDSPFIA